MLLILGVLLVLSALALVAVQYGLFRNPDPATRAMDLLHNATSAARAEIVAEVSEPFADRVVAPFLNWAQRAGKRLTGRDSDERVQLKLAQAGIPAGWTPDRVAAGKVLGLICLAPVGMAVVTMVGGGLPMVLLGGLVGGGIGFFGPDLYLYQRSYERAEQIQRDLPDAIDLMTISVEAGLGFDAALQQVAQNSEGPLAEEFTRVLREMQLGHGRVEALRALADRSNVDDLRSFVGAMVQADVLGISIGQVLRVQSKEMRVRRRQLAETKAQQVPVKITVPLIFCILPALMVAVMGPAVLSIMDSFG